MFDMNQDFFDSRDLIERLEELEELEAAVSEGEASPEEIEEWQSLKMNTTPFATLRTGAK